MRRFLERIRAFFGAGVLDREFDQEIQSHIEMLADDYRGRGLAPQEALRRAKLEFGGAAQLREAHREIRGLPLLDSLAQDARYAARSLRKNPGFTVLAIVTLGIGIGANTAVFTAYDALVLRPLPVADPARLMQVTRLDRNARFRYDEYVRLRDYNRSFAGLAAATAERVSLGGVPAAPDELPGFASAIGMPLPRTLGATEPVTLSVVSGDYFQVLGVKAAAGRAFVPADDSPAAQPVVMIGDSFWESRFARNPGTLGRVISLNGIDVVIAGVTPPNFGGVMPPAPDFWAPVALAARWSNLDYRLYGRLRDGFTPAQAAQDLDAIRSAFPRDHDVARPVRFFVGPASRTGQPSDRADFSGPLPVFAAVSLVLLIACVNVGALLLARSAARQREIAVRLTLGAGRGRLVRQLLTENFVLSLAAGALGLCFSWFALRWILLQAAPFAEIGNMGIDVSPDWRVFLYLLIVAAGSALVFGFAPAFEAADSGLSSGLRDEGPAFAGRLRKSRLRSILVGAQVAVCLTLLIAAGLLAHGSERAYALDLGFDYRNLLSLELVFPREASPLRIAATRTELARELERLPEIESVAVATRLPLVHGGMRSFTASARGPAGQPGAPDVWYTLVTPSYFDALRIPIVRGRNFTPAEAREGSNYDGGAVIVSESTARKFWPGEDAVGKLLAFGPRPDSSALSDGSEQAHSAGSVVIGVARDIRAWKLGEFDDSGVYLPISPAFGGTASGSDGRPMGVIALRARANETAAVTAIRHLLRSAHPDLQATFGDGRTAYATHRDFLSARLAAIGAAFIGLLGLLMTSAGIYGSVAFAVTQRVHEIGVRMALGGTRHAVLVRILLDALRPVVVGMLAGFCAGTAVSRLLRKMLFGLSPLDPLTFIAVPLLLAGVAILAGGLPARRAIRVDPMVSLRYE